MKTERRLLTIYLVIFIVILIVAAGVIYLSRKPVVVYNVSSTVYLTADEYVPDEEKININTASAEELQDLDGIGEKLSEKIIAYREENGNFTSPYELSEVSGISEDKAEKLAPYVKISD